MESWGAAHWKSVVYIYGCLLPVGHSVLRPSQVLEMLESLNGEWVSFQQILLDSEQMLKRHKEKFKTGLIHSADDFKKKAHNLLEDFEVKGIPYPPLFLL